MESKNCQPKLNCSFNVYCIITMLNLSHENNKKYKEKY